jgi:hypothetical protein
MYTYRPSALLSQPFQAILALAFHSIHETPPENHCGTQKHTGIQFITK